MEIGPKPQRQQSPKSTSHPENTTQENFLGKHVKSTTAKSNIQTNQNTLSTDIHTRNAKITTSAPPILRCPLHPPMQQSSFMISTLFWQDNETDHP